MWKYFFLGLLVGWLIEWIIDWVYWRRSTGDSLPQAAGVARPASGVPRAPAGGRLAGDFRGGSDGPDEAAAKGDSPGADVSLDEKPEVESNAGKTTSADTPAGRVGVDAAMGAGSAVSTSSATLSTNAPVYRQEDLEAVDGVGPRIGAMLRNNGITTFARLAATPTAELLRVVASTGERTDNCRLETWAVQARLAANQDWAGLAQLQAELQSDDAGADGS